MPIRKSKVLNRFTWTVALTGVATSALVAVTFVPAMLEQDSKPALSSALPGRPAHRPSRGGRAGPRRHRLGAGRGQHRRPALVPRRRPAGVHGPGGRRAARALHRRQPGDQPGADVREAGRGARPHPVPRRGRRLPVAGGPAQRQAGGVDRRGVHRRPGRLVRRGPGRARPGRRRTPRPAAGRPRPLGRPGLPARRARAAARPGGGRDHPRDARQDQRGGGPDRGDRAPGDAGDLRPQRLPGLPDDDRRVRGRGADRPVPQRRYFAAAAARNKSILPVDLTPAFCPTAPVCLPIVDDHVVWRDDHHYTADYAVARREAGLEGARRRGRLPDGATDAAYLSGGAGAAGACAPSRRTAWWSRTPRWRRRPSAGRSATTRPG